MNTEMLAEIVTPEEYYELLKKEEDLNPKENSQKKIFEDFIADCEKNMDFLSPAVKAVYSDYQKRLAALFQKEKKSKHEKGVILAFQRRVSEMENQENTNTEEFTRKLSNKAGYVNATIILVMILNIGFIIAMALLGSK